MGGTRAHNYTGGAGDCKPTCSNDDGSKAVALVPDAVLFQEAEHLRPPGELLQQHRVAPRRVDLARPKWDEWTGAIPLIPSVLAMSFRETLFG